ncbi:sterol carrier family protein [Herbidospora cretacea]|uniref:sterol carrier family protein n=1 Tax=Herbidospora cretacea TaxID=28444 RepID=UPI0007747D12|nr:sterol carrier family protein [Herbidospora cretacea]
MPPRRQDPSRVRAALDIQLADLGLPPFDGPDSAAGPAVVAAVLSVYDRGATPGREALRAAVRFLLDELVARAPGRTVEVRVPPFAAVQCVEGPRHTRGTPPNVVETDPRTWIALATGREDWPAALADGRVRASGGRADLSPYLPVSLVTPL